MSKNSLAHLRKSSMYNDVIHEGTFPLCLSLGGDALYVNMVEGAIFLERKGKKMYLVVSARKMGSQFFASVENLSL